MSFQSCQVHLLSHMTWWVVFSCISTVCVSLLGLHLAVHMIAWIPAFPRDLGSVCGRLLLPSSPWHSLHAWDPSRVRLSLLDGHGPFPGSERTASCAVLPCRSHVTSRFESPNLVASVWQDGACRDSCGASGEKFGRKRWKLATVWLFRTDQEQALLNGMERLVIWGEFLCISAWHRF